MTFARLTLSVKVSFRKRKKMNKKVIQINQITKKNKDPFFQIFFSQSEIKGSWFDLRYKLTLFLLNDFFPSPLVVIKNGSLLYPPRFWPHLRLTAVLEIKGGGCLTECPVVPISNFSHNSSSRDFWANFVFFCQISAKNWLFTHRASKFLAWSVIRTALWLFIEILFTGPFWVDSLLIPRNTDFFRFFFLYQDFLSWC